MRVAVTGAADIPVALIEQMRAELPFTSILTGYGLTEAGTVTGSRPDDDATTIATTAGRAMQALEVIIADPEGTGTPREPASPSSSVAPRASCSCVATA